jgi:hypothetical protein
MSELISGGTRGAKSKKCKTKNILEAGSYIYTGQKLRA